MCAGLNRHVAIRAMMRIARCVIRMNNFVDLLKLTIFVVSIGGDRF